MTYVYKGTYRTD